MREMKKNIEEIIPVRNTAAGGSCVVEIKNKIKTVRKRGNIVCFRDARRVGRRELQIGSGGYTKEIEPKKQFTG